MRVVKPFMSQGTLKMVYYLHFSLHNDIWNILGEFFMYHIFKLQKRVIRIIMGARSTDSYRWFFKKLKILHLHSQYILHFYYLSLIIKITTK